MNVDKQAPRNSEPAGGQPRPSQAAADREYPRRTEPTAGPALPCVPQGARSHRRFWDLLSPAEQAALRSLGQISAYRRGDALCDEGAAATHVYVLTQGWVKISSVTREHHETVLALRGRGDIVGELAGDCEGYRTAAAVAVGHVRALVVTYDSFRQFLGSSPGADRAYRYVMAQRWREATEMLRSRSVSNGAQRLATLLLELANLHGSAAESGATTMPPLSQGELAGLIGVSRATVTRALRDWRRRGLIGTARHQITIMNTKCLRSAAGRDPAADAYSPAGPGALPALLPRVGRPCPGELPGEKEPARQLATSARRLHAKTFKK